MRLQEILRYSQETKRLPIETLSKRNYTRSLRYDVSAEVEESQRNEKATQILRCAQETKRLPIETLNQTECSSVSEVRRVRRGGRVSTES
jgi:hypothetical protein